MQFTPLANIAPGIDTGKACLSRITSVFLFLGAFGVEAV